MAKHTMPDVKDMTTADLLKHHREMHECKEYPKDECKKHHNMMAGEMKKRGLPHKTMM